MISEDLPCFRHSVAYTSYGTSLGLCYFYVEIIAWWTCLVAAIVDKCYIELIAVRNRSHNILKLYSGIKKVS